MSDLPRWVRRVVKEPSRRLSRRAPPASGTAAAFTRRDLSAGVPVRCYVPPGIDVEKNRGRGVARSIHARYSAVRLTQPTPQQGGNMAAKKKAAKKKVAKKTAKKKAKK
jgi:hypothetical protein